MGEFQKTENTEQSNKNKKEDRTIKEKVYLVYDCGSYQLNILEDHINNLRKYNIVDGNKIDVLVISHLHYDHVNGLDILLNTFNIGYVVLPYIKPIERLIIGLEKINLPEWYYDFLSDPVRYLIEKGVKEVVIITGEEGSPPKFRDADEISSDHEKVNFNGLPKLNDEEKKNIYENEPLWEVFENIDKLRLRKHDGYAYIFGAWKLRFFNYKIENEILEDFKNCLKNKKIDYENQEVLKNVIRTKSLRKELKSCYYKINKDLNFTSLVLGMFYFPKNNITFKINQRTLFEVFREYLYIYSIGLRLKIVDHELSPYLDCYKEKNLNAFGQMLFGDINLKKDNKFDELINHYNGLLDKVFLTQVPHHGSEETWNLRILEKLPKCKHWIISYGINNQYGHPHKGVLEDIRKKGRCFHLNNEILAFMYKVE